MERPILKILLHLKVKKVSVQICIVPLSFCKLGGANQKIIPRKIVNVHWSYRVFISVLFTLICCAYSELCQICLSPGGDRPALLRSSIQILREFIKENKKVKKQEKNK